LANKLKGDSVKQECIEYTLITEDLVVRRNEDTFEEIKFRAALAVTQGEAFAGKGQCFLERRSGG
jgi:hypothetical protein